MKLSSSIALRAAATLFCLLPLCAASVARAEIVYTVTFDDPGGANSSYYSQITAHTLAAGADWARYLQGDALLDVVVRFNPNIPRATGRSMVASYVRDNGTNFINEQGAAAEIRTGIDPNGAEPDIEFVFSPQYLANDLWFDPNPTARSAKVPLNRVDALSVFLHEFGHAFAFNGWRNATNGSLSDRHASTFDELTTFDGSNLYFVGAQAMSIYGGPVPITYGNNFHLGNRLPRPGEDLIPDLMNGVVFFNGARYSISPLDIAIVDDTGLAAVPEPSTLLLAFLAAGALVAMRIRRPTPRGQEVLDPSVDEE